MKKVWIVLGCVVVFLAFAVLLALSATSGLPKAADAFFERIADEDMEGAWRSTAAEFRAATSLAQFQAFLQASALGNYRSASWSSRSIENNLGRLEGTVTVRGGGRIPVELEFIKEDGEWRVLHLRKAEAGLAAQTVALAVPDTADINRLVSAGLFHLAQSIKQDDFAILHRHVSGLWQEQTTPEELRGIFAGFVEHGIDLTGLPQANPVLTSKPAIDEDGVLTVEGAYNHEYGPVQFRMRYIPEGGDWKLLGVGVNM